MELFVEAWLPCSFLCMWRLLRVHIFMNLKYWFWDWETMYFVLKLRSSYCNRVIQLWCFTVMCISCSYGRLIPSQLNSCCSMDLSPTASWLCRVTSVQVMVRLPSSLRGAFSPKGDTRCCGPLVVSEKTTASIPCFLVIQDLQQLSSTALTHSFLLTRVTHSPSNVLPGHLQRWCLL